MIFFVLADEPERGNFVSAPMFVNKDGARVKPIWEPRTNIPIENVSRVVELTADEGWGRLYFLDENLRPVPAESVCWRLFLAQSGWGQWVAAPQFYAEQARFRWEEDAARARSLALLPPLELLAQVRVALLDEQSDAAFARAFVRLSRKQRDRKCRPLARGSYDEWERALLWYLQSQFSSPTAAARMTFFVHAQIVQNRHSWKFDSKIMRPLPPHAAEFAGWTHQYFAPSLDEDFLKRCCAAKQWAERSHQFWIRTARPTQHERLEALLQLRDWLRGKATPAQIEAWLAPAE